MLEFFYDIEPKKLQLFSRKISLDFDKNTLLYGPPKSGKTSLLLYHLTLIEKQSYLYIDMNDIRLNKKILSQEIYKFIKSNNIKILICENFDFSFEINIDIINIFTSRKKLDIENFREIELMTFDFEEYLSTTKHTILSASFANFLKTGNIPMIINSQEFLRPFKIQEMLLSIFIDNMTKYEIFIFFAKNIGMKYSIFQIYNIMKNYCKISKDSLYRYTKELIDEKMIFLIPKYNDENATKKIFIYDFGIYNAISTQKDFVKIFSNALFLELYIRYKEIYYLDGIDFFIPKLNIGIISSPFVDRNISKSNRLKERYKDIKIYYITAGFDMEYKNIKTFWDYVIGN
jgi:hypothetical protein